MDVQLCVTLPRREFDKLQELSRITGMGENRLVSCIIVAGLGLHFQSFKSADSPRMYFDNKAVVDRLNALKVRIRRRKDPLTGESIEKCTLRPRIPEESLSLVRACFSASTDSDSAMVAAIMVEWLEKNM